MKDLLCFPGKDLDSKTGIHLVPTNSRWMLAAAGCMAPYKLHPLLIAPRELTARLDRESPGLAVV